MWKKITDYPNYSISSGGEVYSHVSKKKLIPCYSGARMIVTLYNKNGRKSAKVHRLVASHFLPAPLMEDLVVAHNDGDFTNNKYSNLRWTTQKDNLSDRAIHNTEMIGQKNGRAKLTPAIVLQIRKRYTKRCPKNGAAALAKEFSVSDAAIIKAFRGENWSKF